MIPVVSFGWALAEIVSANNGHLASGLLFDDLIWAAVFPTCVVSL